MTKEEFFTRGREDNINGAKPLALKEGSWQHKAYMSGWDSYIPPGTVPGRSVAISVPSNERYRRVLDRRADRIAQRAERHSKNPFWTKREDRRHYAGEGRRF